MRGEEKIMEINEREKQGVSIVDIKGKMDTITSSEAERYLFRLINQGNKKILLNFADLDFMTSSGLRVLLATSQTLHDAGGELCIYAVNGTVQKLFEISGFTAFLHICDDEAQALREI
jgi:anti-sigma B factor antagonist